MVRRKTTRVFTESELIETARRVSRAIPFTPKNNSLGRDDLNQEAYLHGRKLWEKGQPEGKALAIILSHPQGAARGFQVWLYGRLLSHLRNLVAKVKEEGDHVNWTGAYLGYMEMPDGGNPGTMNAEYIREDLKLPQLPSQPPDEVVDALLAKLPPEAASIVRRLLAGEKVDDIAEALGLTVRNVKRWVRTASEVMNGMD